MTAHDARTLRRHAVRWLYAFGQGRWIDRLFTQYRFEHAVGRERMQDSRLAFQQRRKWRAF